MTMAWATSLHRSFSLTTSSAGPSRATAGPGKPLSQGPITTSFRMRWDRDAEAPPAGSGSPQPKTHFMHIWGQKEAIWNTLFSIFERWWGPPKSRGPGKLLPFLPSWQACSSATRNYTYTSYNVHYLWHHTQILVPIQCLAICSSDEYETVQTIPATSVAHNSLALARIRCGITISLSTFLRLVSSGSPCHSKHKIAKL